MEIDTTCFNAFKIAAQTLNFTEAAEKAHMTQSGVSHHIAKLERGLEVKLFLRIGKKVQLTGAGRQFLSFIENYEDQVQKLYDQIHLANSALRGLVRYSMPESCLLSPHFSLLLKDKSKNFQDVDLKMHLNHSEKVIEDVLSHEVDFGFVTKKVLNPDLEFEAFCSEEYVLVSAKTKADISKLKWIRYPGFDDISSKWVAGQKKSKALILNPASSSISGQTNSLRAALFMTSHDMGCTIVPRHCVETFEDHESFEILDSDYEIVKNQIYIVTLKSYNRPARVNRVIEAFRKMKRKI